jgi:GntR family transcriptional regulator
MTLNLKINKNLKIPYYFQLYSTLSQQIEKHVFNDGDRLPNEMSLCKEFDISRITVRQALKELELNGYIIRERGRGTFVRKKIETHSLQKVSSIIDELKKEGIKTKKKIIENNIISPDERIKKTLGLSDNEKIFFVKRLIYSYGFPLYLTRAYFPYDLTGKISRKVLMDNSFTKIITELSNLKLIHSKRVLEPEIPDKETMELLEIKSNGKKVVHYLQTYWTVIHNDRSRSIYFEEYFNSSKGKFVFEKDYL